jgi:precorrin-6A/cobalt-precorrin-6A reductase
MQTEHLIAPLFSTQLSLSETRRILILGGTGEASQIAEHLAHRPDLTVISSLAGRVAQPKMPAGIVRVGGFGGVDGLVDYLRVHRISLVIDATHPFAARISHNAELACRQAQVPLIAFERLAWATQPQDRWITATDFRNAALMADDSQNRVFLSIGRQELSAFSNCSSAWFLIRTIEEPNVPLPQNSRLILSRGPFSLNAEKELFAREAITHIVSKNSGSLGTSAKIQAARELGLTVLMIDRPARDQIATLHNLDEVYRQLEELLKTGPSPLHHMETPLL